MNIDVFPDNLQPGDVILRDGEHAQTPAVVLDAAYWPETGFVHANVSYHGDNAVTPVRWSLGRLLRVHRPAPLDTLTNL